MLCKKCGIHPENRKRKGVAKGLCCNKCPNHGPWCSIHDMNIREPLDEYRKSKLASIPTKARETPGRNSGKSACEEYVANPSSSSCAVVANACDDGENSTVPYHCIARSKVQSGYKQCSHKVKETRGGLCSLHAVYAPHGCMDEVYHNGGRKETYSKITSVVFESIKEDCPDDLAPHDGTGSSIENPIKKQLQDEFSMGLIHRSHRIAFKMGVIWCYRCGVYALGSPEKLSQRCAGEANETHKVPLARLRKGLHPEDGKDWQAGGGDSDDDSETAHVEVEVLGGGCYRLDREPVVARVEKPADARTEKPVAARVEMPVVDRVERPVWARRGPFGVLNPLPHESVELPLPLPPFPSVHEPENPAENDAAVVELDSSEDDTDREDDREDADTLRTYPDGRIGYHPATQVFTAYRMRNGALCGTGVFYTADHGEETQLRAERFIMRHDDVEHNERLSGNKRRCNNRGAPVPQPKKKNKFAPASRGKDAKQTQSNSKKRTNVELCEVSSAMDSSSSDGSLSD